MRSLFVILIYLIYCALQSTDFFVAPSPPCEVNCSLHIRIKFCDSHSVTNVNVHFSNDEIMRAHYWEVNLVHLIEISELYVVLVLLVYADSCRFDLHV